MAMVTLTPTTDPNVSKTLSLQSGGRIRDVSFSTYLDGAEETFTLKLAESGENFKSDNPYLASNKAEDNEIDVFNAEKYFNERVEDESPGFECKTMHQNKNTELELYQMKKQTLPGTPSISSKSSLNSRSSLLHHIPRNQQSRKTLKSDRKSFFSKLGCNCSDKNSVEIDDQVGRTGSSNCSSGRRAMKGGDLSSTIGPQTKSWVREEMHSGKVNDTGIEISLGENFKFPMLKSSREDDDGRRKSLEIFGSPVRRPRDISGLSMERSLNMLTWDIEIPSNSDVLYNDSNSDASSDLFEIESLSTNPSQYFTRQTSDGMSRTTCYAPSEASIEWSVVTASAADFSTMSDSEELRTNARRLETRDCDTNGNNSPGGEKTRRHSGILSGCYSHKAVMVVGDAHAHRTGEQVCAQRAQKSDFLTPVTRSHADCDVIKFNKSNVHFR